MSKVCRVLRVLEYVGTPEWVAKSLDHRAVKGRSVFADGSMISEAIIGETPELLEYSALAADAERLLEKTTCPDCLGGRNYDPRSCKTCAGLGYRDGSGPWPESAKEQAEVSRELVAAEREWSVEEEVDKIQDRLTAEALRHVGDRG